MIKAVSDCDGLSHTGDMDIFTHPQFHVDISCNKRGELLERKGNMDAPEPFSGMLILIRL